MLKYCCVICLFIRSALLLCILLLLPLFFHLKFRLQKKHSSQKLPFFISVIRLTHLGVASVNVHFCIVYRPPAKQPAHSIKKNSAKDFIHCSYRLSREARNNHNNHRRRRHYQNGINKVTDAKCLWNSLFDLLEKWLQNDWRDRETEKPKRITLLREIRVRLQSAHHFHNNCQPVSSFAPMQLFFAQPHTHCALHQAQQNYRRYVIMQQQQRRPVCVWIRIGVRVFQRQYLV